MIQSTSTRAEAEKDGQTQKRDVRPRKGELGDEAGASGIRPRNRRVGGLAAAEGRGGPLVGGEQELLGTTSATSTPGGSRANSPLPAKHPSRRPGRSPGNGSVNVREREGQSQSNGGLLSQGTSGTSSPILGGGGFGSAFSGLGLGKATEGGSWMSSWNALQGLASSVLGSAEGPEESASTNGTFGKRKTPRPATRKLPDKWGPPLNRQDSAIGEGSNAATAEREARVRAKKMTRVLEGRDESPYAVSESRDPNGKYKARTSSDEPRPGSSQEDEQALVYIHHVQKNDTLQGVVLRYNCKPDVFRKANRFWPNDSIQIRKTVVLPVDACAIKGRPCDAPDEEGRGVDLLAPTPGIEEEDGSASWSRTLGHNGVGTSAERPDDQSENPWVHVRWVLLDASPNSKPIEIARMPRKTLGYFPPRRRKSQNTLSSTISTPRASLDFPASTISPALFPNVQDGQGHSGSGTPGRRTASNPAQQSTLTPSQLSSSNTIGSYFPPTPMAAPRRGRPRRESVGEAAGRLGWMRGPGGVGTLSVRKPGPGNDGLNSWARKHFSGLAIDSLPSISVLGAEQAHFGFGGEELPSIAEGANGLSGEAIDIGKQGQGQGMGLENAAAAIEGWVRRLAVQAQTKVPGTPKGRVEQPDLIELLDGAGSDDGRGFELSPPSKGARTSTPVGTGREDLDGVVRGRERAGAKGGKGD